MTQPSAASPATPHVELECIGSHPGVFVAYLWKNVGLVVWSRGATLQSVGPYAQVCELCRRRFPAGISCIQIIQAIDLPDRDARHELLRVMKQYSGLAVAMATVITARGFVASALRGLITGLSLPWLGTPSATKVHARLEDVLDWLPEAHAARTGVRVERAEILACMTQALSAQPDAER